MALSEKVFVDSITVLNKPAHYTQRLILKVCWSRCVQGPSFKCKKPVQTLICMEMYVTECIFYTPASGSLEHEPCRGTRAYPLRPHTPASQLMCTEIRTLLFKCSHARVLQRSSKCSSLLCVLVLVLPA